IIYGWSEGVKHYWCGARDQGDAWNINKPLANDLHPTKKPVKLIETRNYEQHPVWRIGFGFFCGVRIDADRRRENRSGREVNRAGTSFCRYDHRAMASIYRKNCRLGSQWAELSRGYTMPCSTTHSCRKRPRIIAIRGRKPGNLYIYETLDWD